MIQLFDYLLQYCLRLSQHVVIPEPKHPIARLGEKASPPLICLGLIGMLSAIQLDDQLRFRAKEVHDAASDWLLSTELEAIHLSAPKIQPQLALSVGLVTAEALGARAKCLCATLQFLLSPAYPVFTLAPGGRGEGEGESGFVIFDMLGIFASAMRCDPRICSLLRFGDLLLRHVAFNNATITDGV